MYVLAGIVVPWILVRRAHREARAEAFLAVLCTIVGALIGSRLFFLLQESFLVPGYRAGLIGDGTASWGSYLGGVLALLLYCRARSQAFPTWADLVASCLGLAVAFGRIGCFLNGDDYGRITRSSLGVRYPPASFPFHDQVIHGLIPPDAGASLPVHPVQLYLSALGVALFLIVSAARPGLARYPGTTFALYWVLYCPSRFALEFLRGDQARFAFGWSVPQYLSAIAFLSALTFLVIRTRSPGG
jgi:phosphatidylglycerol:prolipoprotein diacylglycerol transferase